MGDQRRSRLGAYLEVQVMVMAWRWIGQGMMRSLPWRLEGEVLALVLLAEGEMFTAMLS